MTAALESVFPSDPPRFLARTPHGYYDCNMIGRDLVAGGFAGAPRIVTVGARSRAESARIAAVAYCQGTPLRNEIDARDATRLDEATQVATEAVAHVSGVVPSTASSRQSSWRSLNRRTPRVSRA